MKHTERGAVRPKTRITLIAAAILGSALTIPAATGTAHAAPTGTHTGAQASTHTASANAAKALSRAQKRALRVKAQRTKVVALARAKKKTARYVYGASGPNAFDCSGFVMWVYKHAIGKSLPHYSGAQMRATQRVARRHLKPGDLLFYGPGGSQHVAMYIGGGKQIGANNPRVGVVIDSINNSYWRSRYAGAGRVIH